MRSSELEVHSQETAWPRMAPSGPPEPITVTNGWGPLVGQARVPGIAIGWEQVSKISPSGKRECCYFAFMFK